MRLNRFVIVALVLALSACGFQLREQVDLPARLASLRIEGVDPYSPLQRNLELALRRAGAQLAETAGASGWRRVLSQQIDGVPLSAGDTGLMQESLMLYTVDFELVDN